MNALAIAIGATLAVGAAAGTLTYLWAEPDPPADDACRTWPVEGAGTGSTIRFEIDNEGPAQVATVCAVTYGHKKVASKEVAVPAGQKILVDLEVAEGAYFAQIEHGHFVGRATVNLWLCTQSMYIVPTTMQESGGGIGSGDCVDPKTQAKTDQQGVFPTRELQGPAGPAIGVGIGVATLFALGFHFRAKLQFAGFLLFTRLSRPKVLQLETRARIHELVNQEPGIHANAIGERLDMAQGETLYHLHVLVREKVLVRIGNWGLRSFFIAGRWAPQQMRAMAALRSTALERLYRTVRNQPGTPLASIARAAGVSLGRASRLSRRLEEVGLLERRVQGRSLILVPRAGFEALPLASRAA